MCYKNITKNIVLVSKILVSRNNINMLRLKTVPLQFFIVVFVGIFMKNLTAVSISKQNYRFDIDKYAYLFDFKISVE